MNRSWILTVTAGCVLTLAACSNDGSKNSTARSSSNPNATASRESDNNPTVTLTGCLTQGSSSGTYVLQNVRANKDKDAKDVQQATGTIPTSYIVVAASNDVDLQKQLNHEVEIKGKPDISMTGTTGTSGTAGTATSGTTTANQNTPRLLASDIKSVADRCTAPSPQ